MIKSTAQSDHSHYRPFIERRTGNSKDQGSLIPPPANVHNQPLTLAIRNAAELLLPRHPGAGVAVHEHLSLASGKLETNVAAGEAFFDAARDARVHRNRRLVQTRLGLGRLTLRPLEIIRAVAQIGSQTEAQVLTWRIANGCYRSMACNYTVKAKFLNE
jgi:aryl-alcohol dehydrogenase-like predicted oxidoreductase